MTKTIWDGLTQDQLLVQHSELKDKLTALKSEELALRKYIVERAFPDRTEGTNTVELGGGYSLKAKVKFNYKLIPDNDKIWEALQRIKKIGNKGSFIAERLISWHPSFLLTEYRPLIEDKDESEEAKAILKEISTFLEITEAAPELEIKAPKGNK